MGIKAAITNSKELQLIKLYFVSILLPVMLLISACGGTDSSSTSSEEGGTNSQTGLPSDINGLLVVNVEGSYGTKDYRGIYKIDFRKGQVKTHKFLTSQVNGINPYAHDRNTITYSEPCIGNDSYLHSRLKIINEKGVSTAKILPCSTEIIERTGLFRVAKISPDKSKIVIEVDNGKNYYRSQLTEFVVMVFDRNTGKILSSHRGYESPEWLPDGRLLMSSSPANNDNEGIFIASKDFTNLTRIDQGMLHQTVSFLNVNLLGNKLIFTMSGKIWMMSIDRNYVLSGLQELVSVGDANIQTPIWSPDGNYIAFVSYSGAGRSIWTAGGSYQYITFWNINSKKPYVFNLTTAFPSWQQTNKWLGPGTYLSWVE